MGLSTYIWSTYRCRIAAMFMGIHFKNPRNLGIEHGQLENLVDEMLLGIEHRGPDATGLLTISERGKANLVKADVSANHFIHWRENIPKRVRTILGHTRFATQGSPENPDNNHPVEYGTCYAIHNGHISNDTELFDEFSLGRHAEVDSEIIPALFDKFGLDKAHLALQELDGGFATAVVDPTRFPNVTVLAKGWSSPCEVLETSRATIWASTVNTIIDAAERVLGFTPKLSNIESLGAGDILLMEGDTIERLKFKPKTRTVVRSRSTCSTTSTHNYASTSAPTREARLYDECKNCKCSRLWHGSAGDFTGSCKHTMVGDPTKICACTAFVEPVKELVAPLKQEDYRSGRAWEYCDYCSRSFFAENMTLVMNRYVCTNCATAKKPDADSALDIRQRAEDVLTRQKAVAAEFNVKEIDDPAWDTREEAINEHCCAMASEKTGMAPQYVDWLVNECKPEISESDKTGYLEDARAQAGKAYYKAWVKLDDEIAEIENAAWRENWLGGESDSAVSLESVVDEEVLA